MSKNGNEAVKLDLTGDSLSDDLDRLFADAAIAEAERGKAEKKVRTTRHGVGGGKKRPPGTDTPRTTKLIYQILDNTTRTCWIIAGLGTTERMVDTLLEGGSDLQWFNLNRMGKEQTPRNYHLVLDLTRKNEPTFFWEPTERFDKCHFVDNGTQQAGLYRVLHDPLIPGKVVVELAPTDKYRDIEVDSVGIAGPGKWQGLEWEYLRQEASTGKKVITYELSSDQILGALEELTGVTMTEAVKQRALANLAPVTEREGSHHPDWLNSQDWPKQKITPRSPVNDETGETWWDAATYPFEERGLNTKHW